MALQSPAWLRKCAETTSCISPTCERCRSRQKLHRIVDISLIVLASASATVFLLAFAVIRHFEQRHAFWLEVGALAGFALSALIWLIVAVATPAPMAVVDVAKLGARHVHDRLPAEIRERRGRTADEDHRVVTMQP